jgi:hypothetical protein
MVEGRVACPDVRTATMKELGMNLPELLLVG